jgi:hypothetical protein
MSTVTNTGSTLRFAAVYPVALCCITSTLLLRSYTGLHWQEARRAYKETVSESRADIYRTGHSNHFQKALNFNATCQFHPIS